jgi:small-conductance mechanosensitive channel
VILFKILVALVFFGFQASYAESNSLPSPTVEVMFSGTPILALKIGVGAFSAQERARAIEGRIAALSKDNLFDVSKISTQENEISTDIVAGDIVLLNLSDRDLPDASLTRPQLAAKVVAHIQESIEKDRKEKSPQQLLLSLAYAGITTLLLLGLLLLLSKIFSRINTRVEEMSGTILKGLKFRSFELLSSSRLVGFIRWVFGALHILSVLVLLYIYLPLVLSYFPATANWAPKIIGFIVNPVKSMVRVGIDFIPNLFFIVVAIIVTRYILKFIQIFFTEIGRGTLQFEGFHREWAEPTYKLVRLLVFAFALIIIFPYLPGAGSPAFQGVSVFVGVLFSLGSSSAISNAVGGIVITYMRPFKIGDRVKIADTMGDIVEKTLLVTRIRTIKNVEITIPNAMVLSSHIVNYSMSAEAKNLILHTTVTIGYDAPWKQVHELLKRAAVKIEEIETTPEPFVLQTSLDDFYVSYELNAYTCQPNKMASIYSQLHQNIQDEFNVAGVEIMSPHYNALRDGNEVTIPQLKTQKK